MDKLRVNGPAKICTMGKQSAPSPCQNLYERLQASMSDRESGKMLKVLQPAEVKVRGWTEGIFRVVIIVTTIVIMSSPATDLGTRGYQGSVTQLHMSWLQQLVNTRLDFQKKKKKTRDSSSNSRWLSPRTLPPHATPHRKDRSWGGGSLSISEKCPRKTELYHRVCLSY